MRSAGSRSACRWACPDWFLVPMSDSDSRNAPLHRRGINSSRFPRVYFARAIDGEDTAIISSLTLPVNNELAAVGMLLVDPVANEPQPDKNSISYNIDRYRAIVDHDLAILKTCDAMLMDMSIAGRSYIGCVCEMTYAYLWNIPCAVYMGRQDAQRPWLHYHAAVFEQRKDAVAYLVNKLRG